MRLNDELGIKFVVPLGTDGHYAGACLLPGGKNPDLVVTALTDKTPNGKPFEQLLPDTVTYFTLDNELVRVARGFQENVTDIHQIAQKEEVIYFLNTGSNSIFMRDHSGSHWVGQCIRTEFFIGDSSQENRKDINHINSLVWHNDSLFILLHNVAAGFPSSIMEMKRNENEGTWTVIDNWSLPATYGAHDIEIIEGDFYYCDSTKGTLVHYNPRERKVMREIVLGGHTKGLETKGDLIIVGVSEFSRLAETRINSASEIALIDRDRWEVIARPALQVAEKNVGNINDILVL